MPLSLHRLVGRRYGFITPDGRHLAPTIFDQIQLFSAPRTVPETGIRSAWITCTGRAASGRFRPSRRARMATFGAGQGQRDGAGVCQSIRGPAAGRPWRHRPVPLPRRQQPRFWRRRQGQLPALLCRLPRGSVIDVWIKWREGDFAAAIAELTELLL